MQELQGVCLPIPLPHSGLSHPEQQARRAQPVRPSSARPYNRKSISYCPQSHRKRKTNRTPRTRAEPTPSSLVNTFCSAWSYAYTMRLRALTGRRIFACASSATPGGGAVRLKLAGQLTALKSSASALGNVNAFLRLSNVESSRAISFSGSVGSIRAISV